MFVLLSLIHIAAVLLLERINNNQIFLVVLRLPIFINSNAANPSVDAAINNTIFILYCLIDFVYMCIRVAVSRAMRKPIILFVLGRYTQNLKLSMCILHLISISTMTIYHFSINEQYINKYICMCIVQSAVRGVDDDIHLFIIYIVKPHQRMQTLTLDIWSPHRTHAAG